MQWSSMGLSEEDRIRLQHMLDAARAVAEFARGRTREDLDRDLMLRFAVIHGLELVGEARHVSEHVRDAAPMIPWRLIIGMRNRLIHGYADVDLDRVWRTVERDVPALIKQLEALLQSGAG